MKKRVAPPTLVKQACMAAKKGEAPPISGASDE